jgi:hypothetical protein
MRPIGAILRDTRGRSAARAVCLGILLTAFLLAPASISLAAPAAAATVGKNQAVITFPNTITFQIQAQGSAAIERIVLEYGVDVLSCGEVVAKAYPDFTPAKSVSASWTWDMRQSGSEPPGARIWWRWRILETGGQETVTERKEIVWLDSEHPWKSLSRDLVTLHWYRGSQSYGEDLLTAAIDGLQRIDQLIDLRPDVNIDLYIYGSYEDLAAAVLYEPGWTGGLSFGEYSDIILGIPAGEEEWGRGAIAHELMHTLVDRTTFSCLISIPQWLHEGLAMVSEGGLGAFGMSELQTAINDDSIFPLLNLTGGFPEDPDLANLAYSQSWSVVDFLLRQGDPAQMRDLLDNLQSGMTMDAALQNAYSIDLNGLEAGWRNSVGASPLAESSNIPTATPTYVPTLEPLSLDANGSASLDTVRTPGSGRTATPTAGSGASPISGIGETVTGLPWGIIIPSVCIGMLCLIIILIAVLLIAVRMSRRKS